MEFKGHSKEQYSYPLMKFQINKKFMLYIQGIKSELCATEGQLRLNWTQ